MAPNKKKPSVLLIDDNQDMLNYLETELKKDYQCLKCEDALKAMELIKANKPDVVISDIVMPEKDGLELLKDLRDDDELKDIPVMLITAKESEETFLQGITTGANDYIRKPFSINLLKIRLQSLLEEND